MMKDHLHAAPDTAAQDPAERLLTIGGLVGHLALSGAPPALLAEIDRRFDGFTLPCSPGVARAFSLTVTFSEDPRLGGAWEPGSVQPELRSSGDRLEVRRWDFRATLSSSGGRAGPFRGQAECHVNPFAFESLLRVIWSALLPRLGAGLFHACGLRVGERGVMAPGQSGAGKTTLARKAPDPDQVLSDEVVAVHRGPDGRWRLSGTPFFGELRRGATTFQSWPLAAIAFLEKEPSAALEPTAVRLPLGEAVLRALETLLCFESDPVTVEENFGLVIALCGEVPVFRAASGVATPIDAILGVWEPLFDRRKKPRPPSTTAREMIAGLRASIERHGGFAFTPRGGSMRPWLRSGDSLFVEAVREDEIRSGDVVLYWRAGRQPDQDALICHRVLGRWRWGRRARFFAKGDALPNIETFANGAEAQVIGRVKAISREGRARPLPGRLVSLAILLSSLALIPFYRLRARA